MQSVQEQFKEISISCDFLALTLQGMIRLKGLACSTNVTYTSAKAVGTMRSNGLDSLLATKKVMFGLIKYLYCMPLLCKR